MKQEKVCKTTDFQNKLGMSFFFCLLIGLKMLYNYGPSDLFLNESNVFTVQQIGSQNSFY